MRNLLGSLFAVGVASVAAIAATTAVLNTPLRIGPAPETNPATTAQAPPGAPPPAQDGKPAPAPGSTSPSDGAPSGDVPSGSAAPAGAPATPAATADTAEEPDQDPYEGIAPEELPPDLQYSADSSVSFPTNI